METNYSAQDYLDVNLKDDIRVGQTASKEYAIHQFKDYVGNSNACDLECELKTNLIPSDSTVYLQIYNQNTSTWDTVDSDELSAADSDFSLIANVADLTDYKTADKTISCRVYQLGI